MKSPSEIQRAHDLLHWLVLHTETPSMPEIIASLDVLCWILGHDHNPTFEKNLVKMEAFLFGKGIELVDSGEMHYPDAQT